MEGARWDKEANHIADSHPKELHQQQPAEGTYVHGMFMEGARWDKEANHIADSHPKELHQQMPVMHIRGVTEDEEVKEGVYQCPVYCTTIRGPTFTFAAPLRTDRPAHTWIMAAVCLA